MTAIADFVSHPVGVFSELPGDRLRELVEGSQVLSFEPHEAIINHGDEATHYCVLLDGRATVSVLGDGGLRRTLGALGPGETFGDLALMSGEPNPADVIADTPCDVLLIPVSLFQSIIVAEPRAVRRISRHITDVIRNILGDPEKARALRTGDDPYGLNLKGERHETILVINCGSSSLKYSLYDTADEGRRARGLVERIGLDGTRLKQHAPRGETSRELPRGGFGQAFQAMVASLADNDKGVLGGAAEISLIAHRVVHGGLRFSEATLIDDEVLRELEALSPLAPLHNPVNLDGIREMRLLCPAAPQVAVFDTAFHHTLPEYAYRYGLPADLADKHAIRRYGFHGTSHNYVALRAAQFLERRPSALRLVSCHLGNGSSVCAVNHGRSVDTSMGFTPAEGLIMGTRCGDIDAGVLAFLERAEGMSAGDSETMLNRESGLLGLSGVSSDMREVLKAASGGNHRALIALKAYCYRVRKYIGAYAAAMGGLDAIAFTAGIGQHSAETRALALQGLEFMGVRLDPHRNQTAPGDEVSRVSSEDSPVTVLVVPTDEERMMAREALRAVSRSHITRVLRSQKQEPFLVEVSAHHIHLTQEHVEALFGEGHELTRHADLSQPGQFACKEQLTIVGPKGRIERVRVLGPTRKYTQIEIALTEQFKLGVHPPIRESGDIAGTPGCTLEGPAGSVEVDKGVICAWRHIHMTPEDALRYGVRDKSVVRVRIAGDRELIFGDVLVRVDPRYALAMHIDTDEANAANVQTGAQGFIDGIQTEG
jgi:acetate kinase